MIQLEPILKSLTASEVEFVIVGKIAIFLYGWKTIALKLEFCYSRTNENLKKLVAALSEFSPRLRGFPENLPFVFDISTLRSGTNFTFTTDVGDVDLLGEVAGVGNYNDVFKSSECKELFGITVKVLTLEGLIKAKRAAGRTKDLLVLPELEALLELQNEED
ncbi:MAG: hypothetical protein ACR2GD_08445 [Pyrinomonadaceae bacterium]